MQPIYLRHKIYDPCEVITKATLFSSIICLEKILAPENRALVLTIRRLQIFLVHFLKGSLTRDFRLQVSFMNQWPPGPQVFHWGRFEFFQKFAEIFANEYLSPVSLTPAINCLVVSTTPAKNLSPVSTTPAINPCHGEITKNPKKLKNCSPVSTTPTINYSAVSRTPAIKESCLY